MAKIRRELEGRNESEVFSEFMKKEFWVSTRSEGDETGGWWRILNWMTGLSLEVEYNATGTITGHYWSK